MSGRNAATANQKGPWNGVRLAVELDWGGTDVTPRR